MSVIENLWTTSICFAFVVAALITGLLLPSILRFAIQTKLFDAPDKRKIHHGRVPRLGGIAFVPSIIFTLLLTVGLSFRIDSSLTTGQFSYAIAPTLFLVCSLMLLYVAGVADDFRGMRYSDKFVVQIVCALLTVISGTLLGDLYGLLGFGALPVWLSMIITAFVVVYIINSINFIDGIDGLCAGIAIITLTYFGVIFTVRGEWLYALVAWTSAGTLVPFLYFNLIGDESRGKKIFMGDTGSLTIGMIMAFLAIEIASGVSSPSASDTAEWPVGVNPLIQTFAPLILPLFDLMRVFIHRVRAGRNPFYPDKAHIHHKLLALGLTQHTALAILLLGVSAFLAANLLLSPLLNVNIIVVADIVVWTCAQIMLTQAIRHREKRLGVKLYE